jgi:hypothetical protein
MEMETEVVAETEVEVAAETEVEVAAETEVEVAAETEVEVAAEMVVTVTMRTMKNGENGGNSEGTISDNYLNWSRSVCWMSLIYEKN